MNEKIKVFYNGGFLYFSPIECQIVYKREILKSDKDLEDAEHLESVFRKLNKDKMDRYSILVLQEFENG